MNSMRTVTIAALSTAEEMRKLLETLANDDESDFRLAFDLNISHIYSRAQGFDMRFVDVEIMGYDFHYVKSMRGRMLHMATLSHLLENRVSCAVERLFSSSQIHLNRSTEIRNPLSYYFISNVP